MDEISANRLKQITKENFAWSNKHSRQESSRARRGMTPEEKIAYHKAYVQPMQKRSRRARRTEYLKKFKGYKLTPAQWKEY